jgi:hypothetical protein
MLFVKEFEKLQERVELLENALREGKENGTILSSGTFLGLSLIEVRRRLAEWERDRELRNQIAGMLSPSCCWLSPGWAYIILQICDLKEANSLKDQEITRVREWRDSFKNDVQGLIAAIDSGEAEARTHSFATVFREPYVRPEKVCDTVQDTKAPIKPCEDAQETKSPRY